MTGMVSHPVVGVISDSSALSTYCVHGLAPFDVSVTPIESSKRVKLIEPNWVTVVRRVDPVVTMCADVLTVSSICILISCDRSSLRKK